MIPCPIDGGQGNSAAQQLHRIHHDTLQYVKKKITMESESKSTPVRVDAGIGIFWFIGWLFTIAFAKLVWWQALLGLAAR